MEIASVRHRSEAPAGVRREVVPGEAPRYERKFVVEDLERPEIEAMIRLHPALFRPMYAGRYVNNLYLDDPARSRYGQSVEGVSNRSKLRIRWYDGLWGTVESPRLEVKIKSGAVGWKEGYLLPEIAVDERLSRDMLVQAWADVPAGVREGLEGLDPVLLNRYYRTYYESADRRYRLTLDTGLTAFPASRHGIEAYRRFADDWSIVELKYALEDAAGADRVAGALSFRAARFSKYVWGVERLDYGL
jgi:hypothetical protein